MAVNSFHKYVSAIRKSKSFKPVLQTHPLVPSVYNNKVIAMCKDTRYHFGPSMIQELQPIIGKDNLVISADYRTNEMYGYDWWLF